MLGNEKEFTTLRLSELEDDQVEDYFIRFASQLVQGKKQQSSFVQTLCDSFFGDENLADVLRLPFNLNCFCYLTHERRDNHNLNQIPRTQLGLMEAIIHRLTEGVNLPEMAGQALTGTEFRLILRRLAFDVLTNDAKRKILTEEARERVRHTLSTILSPSRSELQERNISRSDVVRLLDACLLYTSPSPRDQRGSRMPSSA